MDALDRRSDRSIKVTGMGSLTRSKGIRIVSYLQEKDQVAIDEFEDRRENFNTMQADLKDKMHTPEQRELFEKIVTSDEEMNNLFTTEIVPAINRGSIKEAEELVSQANEIRANIVDMLDKLSITVNEEGQLAVAETEKSQKISLQIQLISTIISALIGTLLVIFISRNVSRNLNKVIEISDKIADGDLSVIVTDIQSESSSVSMSLEGGYKEVKHGTSQIKDTGEKFNGISTAVSTMVDSVTTVSGNLAAILENTEKMNASVQEIAATSKEAAAGVEQTSASSQQTSSSMEEVAQSSDELSKLAEELNGLVRQFKL